MISKPKGLPLGVNNCWFQLLGYCIFIWTAAEIVQTDEPLNTLLPRPLVRLCSTLVILITSKNLAHSGHPHHFQSIGTHGDECKAWTRIVQIRQPSSNNHWFQSYVIFRLLGPVQMLPEARHECVCTANRSLLNYNNYREEISLCIVLVIRSKVSLHSTWCRQRCIHW